MNWLNVIALLLAAFLAVFLESHVRLLRNLLGAQIDLLPALMVYAALTFGLGVVTALACLGGLWFDSLSANPLGITILPLFLVGTIVHRYRDLILRNQPQAQFTLGLGASALSPLLVVVLLLNLGYEPMLGWHSLWQWLVMALGGAAITPLLFRLFDHFSRVLNHPPRSESGFRPDREIKRGRLSHVDR